MKRLLFPLATTLLGAVVGPFMLIFPVSLFPPAAFVAIAGGSQFAALGGLIFGLIFSAVPSNYLDRTFLARSRVKPVLLLLAVGALSGALTEVLFRLYFGELGRIDAGQFALFAYAGAISAIPLWLIVGRLLTPNFSLNRAPSADAPRVD